MAASMFLKSCQIFRRLTPISSSYLSPGIRNNYKDTVRFIPSVLSYSQQSLTNVFNESDISAIPSDVMNNVNEQIQQNSTGRLFAVVHLAGKQRKVTAEDLIVVLGNFPPDVGERIRLEKVLMVGSKDFTVIGRPMLQRNQVCVEATIIEKTLEVPKIISYYRRRKKKSRKMWLNRTPLVTLRINSIELNSLKE